MTAATTHPAVPPTDAAQVPPQFRTLAARVQTNAKPVRMENTGLVLYPPTGTRTTWRVRYTVAGKRHELSAGRTIESLWQAVQRAHTRAQRLALGRSGHAVQDMVEHWIADRLASGDWKERTAGDRRRDLHALTGLDDGAVGAMACSGLDLAHLRAAVQTAGSPGRGKFLAARLRALLVWGQVHDYLTPAQVVLMDRVAWEAPAGYQVPASRKKQARRAGVHPQAVDRGDVLTHDQTVQLALAMRAHYQHGEGLIHAGALLGARFGELVAFTASRAVADQAAGNYVDTDAGHVEIRIQVTEHGDDRTTLPKANKIRDVVIPRVEKVPTGFDLCAWLAIRGASALAEQAGGTNPHALLFPAPKGGYWRHGSLYEVAFDRAYADLKWHIDTVTDARGRTRHNKRFTLHSLRDRYAVTAVDHWGYKRSMLLAQGAWEDMATVERYYYGTTDDTMQEVRDAIGPTLNSDRGEA